MVGRGLNITRQVQKPGSPRQYSDGKRGWGDDVRGGGDRFENLRIEMKPDSEQRTVRTGRCHGAGDVHDGGSLLGDWDPMKADYQDPSFNSYSSGPGRDLPTGLFTKGHHGSRSAEKTKLFVSGIPPSLNENGVGELCGRYGHVQSLRLCTKVGQPNFAFVAYKSFQEADAAREGLSGFHIEDSFLRASFAMSEEQLRKKREAKEEERFHVVNSHEGNGIHELRGTNNNYKEDRRVVDDRTQSYYYGGHSASRLITRNHEHTERSPMCTENMLPTPGSGRGRGIHKHIGDPVSTIQAGEKAKGKCQFCGTEGAERNCSRCKAPYCNKQCQALDWNEREHGKRCTLYKAIQPENAQAAFERRFNTDLDIGSSQQRLPGRLDASRKRDADNDRQNYLKELSSGEMRKVTAAIQSQTEGMPRNASRLLQAQDLPNNPNDRPTAAKFLREGMDIQIEVLHADSPGQWWVRQIDEAAYSKLQELRNDMTSHYSNMKPNKGYTPGGFNLVACRYRKDEYWYRARVEDFDTKKLKVCYVDYGNTEYVPFHFVHSLASEHQSMPLQAVPISLVGIRPRNGEWSPQANLFLFNEIKQRKLGAKVVSADLCKAVLDVFVDGTSFSQILVEAGFAEFVGANNLGLQSNRSLNVAPSPARSGSHRSEMEGPPIQKSELESQRTRHRSSYTNRSDDRSRARSMDRSFKPGESPRSQVSINGARSPKSESTSDNDNGSSLEGRGSSYHQRSGARRQNASNRPTDRHLQKISRNDLIQATLPDTDDLLPVRITEVRRDYFHVVLEKDMAMIQNMIVDLQNVRAEDPGFLRESNLVCARFSGDGLWHRAEVTAVSTRDIMTVRYIDYGNEEKTERKNLSPFKDSLKNYKVFAVACTIQGTRKPLQGVLESLKSHLLLLKRVTSAVITNEGKSIYPVDLIDPRTQRSVIQPHKPAAVPSNRPEDRFRQPYPDSRHMTANNMESSKTTASLFTASSKPNLPTNTPSPRSATVLPKVLLKDDLKYPVLETGEFYSVALSDNTSPSNITVQVDVEDTLKNLNAVQDKLQETTKNYTGSYMPSRVGELVCVKRSEDGVWYRAETLGIGDETCHIRFIDYGDGDKCSPPSMMMMPRDLALIPVCSVTCSLQGVEPVGAWDVECITPDESGRLGMKVLEKKENHYVVDLTHPSTDESVTDVLVNSGVLQKVSEGDPPRTEELKSASKPDFPVCDLPVQEEIRVCIWHINGPDSFYVQCCEDTVALEHFQTMNEEMYEACNEAQSNPVKVQENQLYAVKSSDGSWYRARAARVSTASVQVFYIDYGNSEEVALTNIKVLPDGCRAIPAQAVHCGIHCISGTRSDGSYSDEAKVWFSDEGLRTGLGHLSHCGKEGEKYKVMKIKNDNEPEEAVLVVEKMIDAGHARVFSDNTNRDLAETLGSADVRYKYTDLPQATLSRVSDVVVTDLTDPGNFYITPYTADVEQALGKLEIDIKDYCSSVDWSQTFKVSTGDVCCAYSSAPATEGWYRAAILHKSNEYCEVLFFDYGNRERVSQENLRPMSKELMQVPPFALRCNLKGVDPLGHTYSEKSVQEFSDLVLNKISSAELSEELDRSSIGQKIFSILLTTDGTDVARKLIQKQVAKDLTKA